MSPTALYATGIVIGVIGFLMILFALSNYVFELGEKYIVRLIVIGGILGLAGMGKIKTGDVKYYEKEKKEAAQSVLDDAARYAEKDRGDGSSRIEAIKDFMRESCLPFANKYEDKVTASQLTTMHNKWNADPANNEAPVNTCRMIATKNK